MRDRGPVCPGSGPGRARQSQQRDDCRVRVATRRRLPARRRRRVAGVTRPGPRRSRCLTQRRRVQVPRRCPWSAWVQVVGWGRCVQVVAWRGCAQFFGSRLPAVVGGGACRSSVGRVAAGRRSRSGRRVRAHATRSASPARLPDKSRILRGGRRGVGLRGVGRRRLNGNRVEVRGLALRRVRSIGVKRRHGVWLRLDVGLRRSIVVVGLAVDRLAEVPESRAEGLAHLRQALRTQHQQRDQQDEQQMSGLKDVPDHALDSVPTPRAGVCGPPLKDLVRIAQGQEPPARRFAPPCRSLGRVARRSDAADRPPGPRWAGPRWAFVKVRRLHPARGLPRIAGPGRLRGGASSLVRIGTFLDTPPAVTAARSGAPCGAGVSGDGGGASVAAGGRRP